MEPVGPLSTGAASGVPLLSVAYQDSLLVLPYIWHQLVLYLLTVLVNAINMLILVLPSEESINKSDHLMLHPHGK